MFDHTKVESYYIEGSIRFVLKMIIAYVMLTVIMMKKEKFKRLNGHNVMKYVTYTP